MTIKQRLQDDMKQAVKNKAKDKKKLQTIRMIIDRIQKREKELKSELDDANVIPIIMTFRSQTLEELREFKKAGKTDKVIDLTNELVIIDSYMPTLMSEEEIRFEISKVISELENVGVTPNKGAIMKFLMPIVKGKADNKMVMSIVSSMF